MRRAAAPLVLLALLVPGCLSAPEPPIEGGYRLTEVAAGFDTLAQFAFDPQGRLWVTERQLGQVFMVENGTRRAEPFTGFDVLTTGEQGLLGIAFHPDYPQEPWVYLYYTYGEGGTAWNRLVRVRDEGGTAGATETLLDRIPGGPYHDGGVLAFGPDGMLWVTTGEAHAQGPAQDVDSVSGKILRLTPEGAPAPDNPFGAQNPAYTLGHRNVFGIGFDAQGRAWISENGPATDDEVNLLTPGGNYGWPEVKGQANVQRFENPKWVWRQVVAPTGIAVAGPAYPALEGDLVVGDYIYKRLHHLKRDGDRIVGDTLLSTAPGGIVAVREGPEGKLYVATPKAVLRLDLA